MLSKLRKFEQQTVKDILILLEEGFGRTKTEKIDDLIMTMKNGFKVSSVETEQSWWDKCDSFKADVDELGLKDNLNLFLCRWMIVTARQGNKLTDDDDRLFRKEICETRKYLRNLKVFSKRKR